VTQPRAVHLESHSSLIVTPDYPASLPAAPHAGASCTDQASAHALRMQPRGCPAAAVHVL
jgi:hypothetical protein